MSSDLPPEVEKLIDQVQYEEAGEFPVEQGYIYTTCSSVENGNPLFWDDDVAREITAGPIAPPTMISVWFRPHQWSPGRTEPAVPLQVHFDMKRIFAFFLRRPLMILASTTTPRYESNQESKISA